MSIEALTPRAGVALRDRPRAARWRSHAVYFAAIGVLYYIASTGPAGETWKVIVWALMTPLIVAGVVWRDRLPYLLPVMGIAELIPIMGAELYHVGMLSLAMRRPGRVVWMFASVAVVVSLVRDVWIGNMTTQTPVTDLLQTLIGTLAFASLPALVGRYIRVQEDRLASAAEQAARAEAERDHAEQQAARTERERIARELHDSLGRVLTLVSMQAGALEVTTRDPELAASAATVRETARTGLGELRTVVHALGEDAADHDPASTSPPR